MLSRRSRLIWAAAFGIICYCPTPGLAADYAALLSDTSNPYWKTLETGLRETAANLKIDVNMYALQSASDAEGQLNQCEAALLKKPKALLFAAVDAVNLGPCLKKADGAGVLLVDLDGNTDEARAAKLGVHVAFSVASDNFELGARAAKYLKGRSGKVLVLEGLSVSQPGNDRIRGFKETLPQSLTIVASQPADWDRLKAADVVNRVLVQHPDLKIIFAANDTMALGAVEALSAAGKQDITVIGIDGTTDAVKAIKAGRLTASIAQLPYLMGKTALEKAKQFLDDRKPIPFKQVVPVVALDRAVLENGSEPLLQYVR